MSGPAGSQHDATVRAIARRVLDELDARLPAMGAAYQREIPEYARLTPELLEREVLRTSRRVVEAYFGPVAEGRDPAKLDLSAIALAGRRRLEMGVSLDSGLHAFRLNGRETWRAVVAALEPGEEHALADIAGGWIEHVDRVSSSFAEGYLAASHEHLRRLDARRSAIVDALLEAGDWGEVAAVTARFSVTLAPRYRPVLLAGDDVLVRIDLLVGHAPPDTLAGVRGDRVLALLPADEAGEPTGGPDADPAVLAKVGGAALACFGRGVPPGPALAAEVRHVEAVLSAAGRAGHLEGVFGPEDLLLEQLVAGSERVSSDLAARVLDPLIAQDPDGIFTSTLRTYLGCGSVPDTAALEVVHANTVAYRLRRVRDLTGLDPRIPTEAALLVIAVTARGAST